MHALKRFASRGSSARQLGIDETSERWKERSGRSSGPSSYVPGDLCRAMFRQAVARSYKERDAIYGGPVMLVGVVEGDGIPTVGAKGATPNTYCTLVPVDMHGNEVDAEKRLTRVVPGNAPAWDEVHAMCTATDLNHVAALRVKVKHYESKWHSERIGSVDIDITGAWQLLADANLGRYHEGWYEVSSMGPSAADSSRTLLRPPASDGGGGGGGGGGDADASTPRSRARSGSGGSTGAGATTTTLVRDRSLSGAMMAAISGAVSSAMGGSSDRGSVMTSTPAGGGSGMPNPRVRVWIMLHKPPPDPQPVAVHIGVMEAKSVMIADATGFSDPYVRIRPQVRSNEYAKGADGRGVIVTTQWAEQTLDPVWREEVLFTDQDGTGEHDVESLVPPPGPGMTYTAHHRHAIELARTRYLEFVFRDHDALGSDDDLGVVNVSFADLFGEEDAVLSERTLHIRKWYRIRPYRSMDKSLEGALGHVRLHITLVFDAPLLPAGWQEATDNHTNQSYFHNVATGASQWDEPAELVALRADVGEGMSGGASSTTPDKGVDGGGAGARRLRRGTMDAMMMLTVGSVVDSVVGGGGGASEVLRPIAEGEDDSDRDGSDVDRGATATSAVSTAKPPTKATDTAPVKRAHIGGSGASDEEDGDGDGDGGEVYDAEAVARQLAAMDLSGAGKKKAAAEAAEFSSPVALAGERPMLTGTTAADRMKQMADMVAAEKEAKRVAEEAVLAAKLAAMSAEERAEYEAMQQREERREQRKNRMLHSQLGAYGSSSGKRSTLGARGRGRGGKK